MGMVGGLFGKTPKIPAQELPWNFVGSVPRDRWKTKYDMHAAQRVGKLKRNKSGKQKTLNKMATIAAVESHKSIGR